jgi:hypothetical protein
VQPQDRYSDCAAISAEIEANNQKVTELGSEQGLKVGQNVAAGVAGLVVWPLLFAMDFQDTAGKEVAALQSRQQYLATLAQQRCAAAPPSSPPPARKRWRSSCAKQLCRAALRDRRVAQGVGREGAVLALGSVEPSAFDNLLSIGGHADNGHCHPRASGLQLHRISNLKRHCRPPDSGVIRLAAWPIINRYDASEDGQFATCRNHEARP